MLMKLLLILVTIIHWAWSKPLLLNDSLEYTYAQISEYYECHDDDDAQIYDMSVWGPCEPHFRTSGYNILWKKIVLLVDQEITTPFHFQYYIATEDSIQMLVYRDNFLIDIINSGAALALKDRPVQSRLLALPLLIKDPGVYTVFIRTVSHNPPQQGPALFSAAQMQSNRVEARMIMYPYVGVGLAILTVNLLMYFFLRRKTYLPYILFHIAMVCGVLILTGHSSRFFPEVIGGWPQFLALNISVISFCFVWFSRVYFKQGLSNKFFFILSIISLSNVLTWSLGWPNLLTQEIFFLVVILCVCYALLKIKDMRSEALFYLLSWGGYSVFVLVYALGKNSFIEMNLFVKYSGMFAHVWEMTIFTVAITFNLFQDLRASQKAAHDAAQEKSNLLKQLAHELRTPMQGILSEVEAIDELRGDQAVGTLSHSTYIMSHMLNNIIDNSDFLDNSSHDELPISHPIEIDVVQLISSKLSLVSQQFAHQEFQFIKSVRHYSVKMDLTLFSKLMDQVLDNAFQYGDLNSVQLELRFDDQLEISVSNQTGENPIPKLGIKKEFQLTSLKSGLGLGAPIIEKSVELLGGTMAKEFSEGVYKLSMRIPYESKNLIEEDLEDTLVDRLLIVDDNKINRKVLAKIGEQLGYHCEFAEDGLKAFETFKKEPFQLIFMDIQMPVMDGLESTKCIRQYEKENQLKTCHIIGVTAHGTMSYEEQCFEAGMDLMLSKPVKMNQMRNAITSIMIRQS